MDFLLEFPLKGEPNQLVNDGERKAVSVFPDPVGEQRSRCCFSMMAGMASFWGGVKSGNLSLNHFLTGGQSRSYSASDSNGESK